MRERVLSCLAKGGLKQALLFLSICTVLASCAVPAAKSVQNENQSQTPYRIDTCTPLSFSERTIIDYVGTPFAPYIQSGTSVVLLENSGASVFCTYSGRIELSLNILEDKGALHLWHEFGHAVTNRVRKENRVELLRSLEDAYITLVTETGLDWNTDYMNYSPQIEVVPLFALFDESYYMQSHPSRYGHPYSSYDELFASALTVLHFFPDQFVARFQNLPREKQDAVKTVFKAMIGTLKALDANEENIRRLLPRYEMLRQVLA